MSERSNEEVLKIAREQRDKKVPKQAPTVITKETTITQDPDKAEVEKVVKKSPEETGAQ